MIIINPTENEMLPTLLTRIKSNKTKNMAVFFDRYSDADAFRRKFIELLETKNIKYTFDQNECIFNINTNFIYFSLFKQNYMYFDEIVIYRPDKMRLEHIEPFVHQIPAMKNKHITFYTN